MEQEEKERENPGSIAERITLNLLDMKKEDWDKLTNAKKSETIKDFAMNSYAESLRNNDFIWGIELDILSGVNPKATSTEILKEYRKNRDWRGELFRIVESGLNKFLRKHELTKKWNNDKRLLFFLYFLKLFLHNLNSPSMFKKLFGVTTETIAKDYSGLHLRPASPDPLFLSLRDDKAASMVNDMLDIMELPVIDGKKVERKRNRELRKAKKGWIRKSFKDRNLDVYRKAVTLKIDSLNKQRYSLRDAVKDACSEHGMDFTKEIVNSFKNKFYGNGKSRRGREVQKDLEDALRELKACSQNS